MLGAHYLGQTYLGQGPTVRRPIRMLIAGIVLTARLAGSIEHSPRITNTFIENRARMSGTPTLDQGE